MTRSRAGLSNTVAGMKVTLIGRGGSMPGGKSAARGWFHQFFRPIGPFDFFGNADEIAQNAGALRDREAALRVDPPRKKVGDPAFGVRVAGAANIRPDTAGRAVAAHHVKELMR